MLNDNTLKDFDALAVVEPYIYRHPHTGLPTVPGHQLWQLFTPSIQREDGAPRHAFRSMIWVNARCKARAVEVASYDITAVRIDTQQGAVLLLSMYDARDGKTTADLEQQLQHKLGLASQAIS